MFFKYFTLCTILLILSISASGNTLKPKTISYIPLASQYAKISKEVKSGQGLYQALNSVGVQNSVSLEIINALRDEVEFSKLKVGDKLESRFDNLSNLSQFMYSQNASDKHIVTWNKITKSWNYNFYQEPTEWKKRMISGQLKKGSTLLSDLLEQGLEARVVNDVIQVLLCKVNFRMSARMGDQYKILLNERIYKNKVIGTKLLYTSYEGYRTGKHEAFLYEDDEQGSTYTAHYTENGEALIRSGLRYPLRRLHVRSGFGWRRHPVTGRRALHRGVDLRARRGDAVYAVARGKVILSTYNKFAGNKIGIKHSDGSSSYYYHLSRRGVRKGQWVKGHQIIGNVGATGRVTGPHLHFGFKNYKGKWMNPLNKRMIATAKLKGDRLNALSEQVETIKSLIIDQKLRSLSDYVLSKNTSYRPAWRFRWPTLSEVLFQSTL